MFRMFTDEQVEADAGRVLCRFTYRLSKQDKMVQRCGTVTLYRRRGSERGKTKLFAYTCTRQFISPAGGIPFSQRAAPRFMFA